VLLLRSLYFFKNLGILGIPLELLIPLGLSISMPFEQVIMPSLSVYSLKLKLKLL